MPGLHFKKYTLGDAHGVLGKTRVVDNSWKVSIQGSLRQCGMGT